MSVSLTVNGTAYDYPTTGDYGWGTDTTGWASAVTAGMLQKAGGAFTLTAEVDFGATYGLKSAYFKSRAANPADAGQIRLGNAEVISWRNNANSANLDLKANASDNLEYDGNVMLTSPMTTQGDIMYEDSGIQRLAVGNTGEVLSVAAGVPAWTALTWTNYTPTGSWVSNATYIGKYRIVGDTLECQIQINCTGAPTSAALTINLPSGKTIDTTKLTSTDVNLILGELACLDAGIGHFSGQVVYSSTTAVNCYAFIVPGILNPVGASQLTELYPFSFGSGDKVYAKFSVPIT